jgi:hypothetical protein
MVELCDQLGSQMSAFATKKILRLADIHLMPVIDGIEKLIPVVFQLFKTAFFLSSQVVQLFEQKRVRFRFKTPDFII